MRHFVMSDPKDMMRSETRSSWQQCSPEFMKQTAHEGGFSCIYMTQYGQVNALLPMSIIPAGQSSLLACFGKLGLQAVG